MHTKIHVAEMGGMFPSRGKTTKCAPEKLKIIVRETKTAHGTRRSLLVTGEDKRSRGTGARGGNIAEFKRKTTIQLARADLEDILRVALERGLVTLAVKSGE